MVQSGRVWTSVSALSWARTLRLLPPFDLQVCQAIARGIDARAFVSIRQLWFHPSGVHILDTVDKDFAAAGHLSFDLMLRASQMELLKCADLEFSTKSVWCPPHKNTSFPYLRQPQPAVWARIRAVHAGRPSSEKLFKRAPREYSELLGKITEAAFGVRLTWHSLRRGGATTRAQAGESAEAIRRFGCWGSEKAVTHYIFP